MMKQTLGFLVLGAATFACSGRYYEVGVDGVAGVGGTRGAAGGAAPGGSSSATAGAPDAVAGTGTAGPAMPVGNLCVPSGAPPALTGPFAEPMVVWTRIAKLTWGTPPLITKPPAATTTYAWAGQTVTSELQAAKANGPVRGVEDFLRQALGLDANAPFARNWGSLLSWHEPVLKALLEAPTGDYGQVGIFCEPSWLEKRTTISARGAGIEDFLFARPIPPPPEGLENPEPNPNLSDRANLEAAVSGNAPCTGCHQLMDPVGYALGYLAANGEPRALDHGLPVDTTGSRAGFERIVEFDGLADFGRKFENDCLALQGIATTFLHAAVLINAPPQGVQSDQVDASVERVQQAFINSDRTYEDLVRAYIQSPAGLRP